LRAFQLRRLRSSETVIQRISGDDRNLVESPVGHSASNDCFNAHHAPADSGDRDIIG
jgi:hypothetical protein